jgi:hypothetical protein
MRARFIRSLLLVAVLTLSSVLATAAAGPARQSAAQRPTSAGRPVLTAAEGGVAEFFKGSGAALRTFSLQAARYDIEIYAQYNPVNDPSGSGECFFDGNFDNLTTGAHSAVGTSFPIQESVPWDQPAVGNLGAGTYRLYIFPGTTCDWSVEVVALGPPTAVTPALDIVSAGCYTEHGSRATPTKVVRMGQATVFVVFYTVSGTLAASLAGQVVVHESGTGPTQTYRLTAANNGTKQFYIGLIFAPKYHAVVGPATATFTITSGTLHVSRTVGFTLAT